MGVEIILNQPNLGLGLRLGNVESFIHPTLGQFL